MTIKGVLTTAERRFVDSSHYRYGGESFKIFTEKTRSRFLPGKHHPKEFLDHLNFPQDLTGKTIVIVNPGNGHLVSECAIRGAQKIIVFEWNYFVEKTIDGVIELLKMNMNFETQVYKKHSYDVPESNQTALVGQADYVLWIDGFVSSSNYSREIGNLLRFLKDDGAMLLTVTHGHSKVTRPAPTMARYTPDDATFRGFLHLINPQIFCEEMCKHPHRPTDVVYGLSYQAPSLPQVEVADVEEISKVSVTPPDKEEKSVNVDVFQVPEIDDLSNFESTVSPEDLDRFVEEIATQTPPQKRGRKKKAQTLNQ